MHEIFIPISFSKERVINTLSPNCRRILERISSKYFHYNFEFLEGISYIFQGEIPEDIIRLCNGEFGKYYFIERDLGNKKVFSSGSTILGNTKLFDSIPEISSRMDGIVLELSSNSLITRSKMSEMGASIQNILFTLSGLIYSIEGLLQLSQENKKEMQEYEGNTEYKSQSKLLERLSEQKALQLQEMRDTLYPNLKVFLETIIKIV